MREDIFRVWPPSMPITFEQLKQADDAHSRVFLVGIHEELWVQMDLRQALTLPMEGRICTRGATCSPIKTSLRVSNRENTLPGILARLESNSMRRHSP